ncbi:MAG TPA: hypothetical protein VKE96_24285 [Vicinamibacterales bacterium]|nr:hypothetical protein [Vicinamibacterales bacterium]
MIARWVAVFGFAAVCSATVGCSGTPAGPAAMPLPLGHWTGEGCLSVAQSGCDLVVGCGHGQFPRPLLGTDGAFVADGTYRIEAGPVSISPPPPARFSGVVSGRTLTVTVVPADGSSPPASYRLQLTSNSGTCIVPCV